MKTKTFLFAATLLFVFTASNAQTTQSQKATTLQSGDQSATAIFDGAWRSADNKGFSVMYNGYFNGVSQDSTGKWDVVHAGTYTVNNDNTITFKILYSSFPDHVGAANTAEYTITGETLKLHHFKKLIDAQGKDITDQMPKDVWDTMTRLK
jgi:hypothetical protein